MQTASLLGHGLSILIMLAATPAALAFQQDISLRDSGPGFAPEQASHSTNAGALPVEHRAAVRQKALVRAAIRRAPSTKRADFNRQIYYKNKLEYSIETGWLPNNIPFVFDGLVGSAYTTWPLHYTLVPNISSVRWQLDNIWGWKFLRGNTDFSFSGSYTAIPRGAETRYFAFDYGIRRNLIPPRSRIAPYVEGRGGIGNINAKGPRGVEYAQGQDMTFTLMVGAGARYNFSPRYGVSSGLTYMHVSNFYLSEPRYENFGINVYGAMVGIYMRLSRPKPEVVR